MNYSAPIRCQACGIPVHKKPRAKTPKYCPACRQQQQNEWVKNLRRRRQEKRRSF